VNLSIKIYKLQF